MSMNGVWNKVRWSLRQRGASATLRLMLGRVIAGRKPAPMVERHPFDVAHGVDTSGLIGGGDLASGHAHDVYITAYAGVPPSRFNASIRRWLESSPVALPESYTFVDLGCGKGRAVMLASQLHFREAVGVELSPELARVAEANVAIWKQAGRAAGPVRIVQGDATEFELPPGPCFVYMANPFGAPVMRRLLAKLEARAAGGGGTLDIMYQNPEQEAVFAEFPAFVQLWSEVIPRSKGDAGYDLVFTAQDRCTLYRR